MAGTMGKTIVPIVDLIARLRPIAKLPEKHFVFAYLSRSTALHIAAYFGMLAVVELLIERGASVGSTANPKVSVSNAICSSPHLLSTSHPLVVLHLSTSPPKGMTPLHLAAIGGHDDVCARLLTKGAAAGAKDKRGRTAQAYAERLGHDAVRRRLLHAKGALVAPAAAGAESWRSRCGGVVFASDDGPHRGGTSAPTGAI